MQGFAYTTLIVLARNASNSDTDTSRESGYLLPSVTGSMYLLVASTTHDLRAGFSLSVDGSRAGQRAFGIGLLIGLWDYDHRSYDGVSAVSYTHPTLPTKA